MQHSAEKIWSSAQEHLRSKLSADTYNMWFASLRASAIDHSHVTLEAANEFCEVWLKDNYSSLLQDALAIAAGRQLQIIFKSTPGTAPMTAAPAAASAKVKTPAVVHERPTNGDTHFNPKNTFDSFVVGNNNNFAYAAAKAVAEAPANPTTRCFFTAASGWARRICCTPSASRFRQPKKVRASPIFRRRNSRTNTLTASRTTSSPSSARNTARPTCC